MMKKRGSPKGSGISTYKRNAVVKQPGYMYYVKPNGTVGSTPLKGKGGKKAKAGQRAVKSEFRSTPASLVPKDRQEMYTTLI
jgi:hypothetical protein